MKFVLFSPSISVSFKILTILFTILIAYLVHKLSVAPVYEHTSSPLPAWITDILHPGTDNASITPVTLTSLFDEEYVQSIPQRLQFSVNDYERIPFPPHQPHYQPPLHDTLHRWERGIPVAEVVALAKYWITTNWTIHTSPTFQKLRGYPGFETVIHNISVRFLHIPPVASNSDTDRKPPTPLLLLHGWPGSILEFLDVIPYLQRKNYVLIIPSLPYYGFSVPKVSSSDANDLSISTGLDPVVIAEMFMTLMHRLNYSTYYVQGGDWGGIIATTMAQINHYYRTNYPLQYTTVIQGIHINFVTPNHPLLPFYYILSNYLPVSWFFNDDDNIHRAYPIGSRHTGQLFLNKLHYPTKPYTLHSAPIGTEILAGLFELTGYFHEQSTRPDTLGIALTDSPFGFLGWISEKFWEWSDPRFPVTSSNPHDTLSFSSELLTLMDPDWLIANAVMYMGTRTITSSLRLYYEAIHSYRFLHALQTQVNTPTWIADFPYEIGRSSLSLLNYRFTTIVNISTIPRGGHFAAVQEPLLLANDIVKGIRIMQRKYGTARESDCKKCSGG